MASTINRCKQNSEGSVCVKVVISTSNADSFDSGSPKKGKWRVGFTSQCSLVCWSRSECRWNRAGMCKCNCLHSLCSWLHSCTDCFHTRWCPLRIWDHGTPEGKCMWMCRCRPRRSHRYCKGLSDAQLLCATWKKHERESPKQGKREGYWLTGLAVVDVGLTVAASVAWLAVALVAANRVLTDGAIETWGFHTLVDINLTGLTCNNRKGNQCNQMQQTCNKCTWDFL